MGEVKDRRKSSQRISEEEREKLQRQVVSLREDSEMSWAEIAKTIGVKSANTTRRLYEETGRDPHTLLEGKGGRTRNFQYGDWCDVRCIAALPDSPCECKCQGENHSGGGDKAREILEQQGRDGAEIGELVHEVEVLRQENERKADGEDE